MVEEPIVRDLGYDSVDARGEKVAVDLKSQFNRKV